VLTVSELQKFDFLYVGPGGEDFLRLIRQAVNAHNQFERCFRCKFQERWNVLLCCENNSEVCMVDASLNVSFTSQRK
jgi:hypothetical protein